MCRLFKVTGRVQGVFFRASTRDVAESLDLQGHAINLEDGSVEVRACGDSHALVALERWLERGPAHARVERVQELETSCSAPSGFRTG